MFIYFELLFFLILSNFFQRKFSSVVHSFIIFFVFAIYIGLRHYVGGDWSQYQIIYDSFGAHSNLLRTDIGYSLINIFAHSLGLGIYGVNFISAIIFLYGFYFFIKGFNLNFSFSLFIAFPYLITIISMGYTRQSIAIGFIMIMLSQLAKGQRKKAFFNMLLAVLFHKTAIIAIIFFIESVSIFWIIVLVLMALGVFLVYGQLLLFMYKIYVLHAMQSGGGVIRLLLLSLISLLFFSLKSAWKEKYTDYFLIRKMAVYSIVFFLLAVATHATTLFDRLSLYFYPLQLIVLNRSILLVKNMYLKFILFMSVILLYSLLLLVWMLIGNHADSWIPYDNILFRAFTG